MSWPNVHGHETFAPSGVIHVPETANMVPTTMNRNSWMGSDVHSNDVGANDFGSGDFPPLSGLPEFVGDDYGGLGFLTLPTEDDWNKWHAEPGEAALDLDGFPPRGRMQVHSLSSPPMGGIING